MDVFYVCILTLIHVVLCKNKTYEELSDTLNGKFYRTVFFTP